MINGLRLRQDGVREQKREGDHAIDSNKTGPYEYRQKAADIPKMRNEDDHDVSNEMNQNSNLQAVSRATGDVPKNHYGARKITFGRAGRQPFPVLPAAVLAALIAKSATCA